MHYNFESTTEAMNRVARALGNVDPVGGLYDLAKAVGAPLALRDIGMKAESLDAAARLADSADHNVITGLGLPFDIAGAIARTAHDRYLATVRRSELAFALAANDLLDLAAIAFDNDLLLSARA